MLGATQQRWRPIPSATKLPTYESSLHSITRVDLPSFIALPHSDRIHRFLTYWSALRGNAWLPRRADLDPLAIPSVLTGIWLITVNSESNCFTTRLSGESVNRFFGRSMAGRDLMEALPEPEMEPVQAQLRRVRDTGCLSLEQGDLRRPDGTAVYGERLFAPFSTLDDKSTPVVDHIVGVTITSGLISQTPASITTSSSQVTETTAF